MQRGNIGRYRSRGVIALAQPADAGRMFLVVVLAILALTVLLTGTAQAAEVRAEKMNLSVWPEYDDPRVLVIMQAELDPSVTLPATVSFNIPKGAEIGMACEVQPNGGHSCKPFKLEDKGDYQTLSYTVESQRKVFTEYYYEAFPAGAGDRAFDMVFRPSFAVATLTVDVQEPARSTGFTLDPVFGQVSTSAENIKTHFQDFPNVVPGEDLTLKIAYSKADADTSVKPKEKGAGGGNPSAAGSTAGGNQGNALLLVLLVGGFAALMFGGYKMFRPAPAGGRGSRGGNVSRSVSTGQRAGRSKEPRRGGSAARADAKFCTGCGSVLRRQDRFCPGCGEEQQA